MEARSLELGYKRSKHAFCGLTASLADTLVSVIHRMDLLKSHVTVFTMIFISGHC